MLNKSLFFLIFVLFTIGVSALYTFPNGYSATKIAKSPTGKIKFMSGSFGFVTDTSQQSLVNYITAHVDLLGLHGTEKFQLKREARDPSGALHFHFQQYNHGLEVDGGELALHVDSKTLEVFALSLSVLPDDKYSVLNSLIQRKTLINRFEAIRGIAPVKNFKMMKDPELVYLLHEDHGHLVWRADVEYTPNGQRVPIRSWLYAHAVDGHHILELNQYMHILNRQVFDAEHNDTLPGELQRVEGEGAVTDPSVNQAYDNVGLCYNFYMQTFQRDSFNGQGAMLKSSVHYMVGYNNAFWNGEQMVFGDGDGKNFTDFTGDLTVICHELTHAVVQATANLRYWRDSGALNEGFADIFGASSDIVMQNNSYSNTTWMIGHKCYLAGQALRYMNNPTQDGYSNDFWPERYQGFQDMGGVHSNSGIANLAYVLLVQGGVHPRQKTTGWVAGVGLDKAMQIFYAALNGYLQSTSDFVAARAATETTALKLYGKFAHDSVAAAWNAVGVPESNM